MTRADPENPERFRVGFLVLAGLDDTPLAAAIGYARNQRDALTRFLEDGRLPLHNNVCERELRREVVGRKELAFRRHRRGRRGQHDLRVVAGELSPACPRAVGYLRDLFCLLPDWPRHRVFELAPVAWQQTLQQPDTQERLAANPFRAATLALDQPHADDA